MKELQYFTRFWHEDVPPDFVASYHDYFPRPEGAITGEWTPRYMFDHWSMRMLREAAPDAKVLVILRDPVERYRSALEAWRPAVAASARGWTLCRRRWPGAPTPISCGRVRELPARQVLVLAVREVHRRPGGPDRRTWEFLGLDPGDHAGETPEETRGPTAEARAGGRGTRGPGRQLLRPRCRGRRRPLPGDRRLALAELRLSGASIAPLSALPSRSRAPYPSIDLGPVLAGTAAHDVASTAPGGCGRSRPRPRSGRCLPAR